MSRSRRGDKKDFVLASVDFLACADIVKRKKKKERKKENDHEIAVSQILQRKARRTRTKLYD